MAKVYQSFNNRINAWVKYRVMDDGRTRILNTKQSNPTDKFKGVRVR